MKKTLVIHTGGTISMQETDDGRVRETSEHPLSHIKLLRDFPLEEKQLFHLPSPHITPQHMLELANFIEEHAATNQYNGIVVTHGTDTLEETAFFIDLSVQTLIPIVFTGAMRPSNEIGSDGLYNLLGAIRTASNSAASHRGVLVVMNDEIHSAQFVTKTSSSNVATFQSNPFGPVGIITKTGIYFYQTTIGNKCYPVQRITKQVLLLKAYAGMSDHLFHAFDPQSIDGIVIEALGQGNVPPAIVPTLQKLIQQKVTILFVSRCFNGVVQPVYDYTGGGGSLIDEGIIFANHLNGQKARLKLLLLLEREYNHQEITQAFQD